MKIHWHFSVENVLFAGVSAIVVINVLRWVSAKAASADSPYIAKAGSALGATVHF